MSLPIRKQANGCKVLAAAILAIEKDAVTITSAIRSVPTVQIQRQLAELWMKGTESTVEFLAKFADDFDPEAARILREVVFPDLSKRIGLVEAELEDPQPDLAASVGSAVDQVDGLALDFLITCACKDQQGNP